PEVPFQFACPFELANYNQARKKVNRKTPRTERKVDTPAGGAAHAWPCGAPWTATPGRRRRGPRRPQPRAPTPPSGALRVRSGIARPSLSRTVGAESDSPAGLPRDLRLRR